MPQWLSGDIQNEINMANLSQGVAQGLAASPNGAEKGKKDVKDEKDARKQGQNSCSSLNVVAKNN